MAKPFGPHVRLVSPWGIWGGAGIFPWRTPQLMKLRSCWINVPCRVNVNCEGEKHGTSLKPPKNKHLGEKRETIGMLDEGILGVSRYLHVCRRYAISIIYVYPGYSMYWYCGLHTNIEAYLPSNVFMLFMVQGTRLVARSLVTHLQSCKQ